MIGEGAIYLAMGVSRPECMKTMSLYVFNRTGFHEFEGWVNGVNEVDDPYGNGKRWAACYIVPKDQGGYPRYASVAATRDINGDVTGLYDISPFEGNLVKESNRRRMTCWFKDPNRDKAIAIFHEDLQKRHEKEIRRLAKIDDMIEMLHSSIC